MGGCINGDVSTGATPVFDHDLLTPNLRQPIGNDAGGSVRSATRRETNQKPDYAGGPGLCP